LRELILQQLCSVDRRAVLAATVVALAISARAGRTIDRSALLARARLSVPVDAARIDIRRGPGDVSGFEPGEQVRCRYEQLTLGGNSPKFACTIAPGDSVKVKYGSSNGEVVAEVAATRLVWALGFAVDRMYPVDVVCEGCPSTMAGTRLADGSLLVTPATIERRYPAPSAAGVDDGWAWRELDLVSEEDGGASRAERDALKLLAVFLQHTDTKMPQQRIVCVDHASGFSCEHPLLMLNDLGLTFGRASRTNANAVSSANFAAWSQTPVWQGSKGCTGNLPRSFTGTLENPAIGEEGRVLLAERLGRLTDEQLRELFTVAGVDRRSRDPRTPHAPPATVDEWVAAFKAKRTELTSRRCA
jgi:hypothetical protein